MYDAVAPTADTASQLCFCNTFETICLAFPAIALDLWRLYLQISKHSLQLRINAPGYMVENLAAYNFGAIVIRRIMSEHED
jgi:hypothetical protein